MQNAPLISGSPLLVGTELEIGFSISSAPANSAYPLLVEFFVSDGGGEGAKFIASTIYTAANFAAGLKTVSFVGASPSLVAGVSKIVGVATDLNGNTSEFSAQRTVASGGVALRAAAPETSRVLSSSAAPAVSRTQVLSLIDFLNNSKSADGNVNIVSSDPASVKYDASGNGVVSPLDLFLVVRGLQKGKSVNQPIPSAQQLAEKRFWDSVLNDLTADDLLVMEPALLNSKWLK